LSGALKGSAKKKRFEGDSGVRGGGKFTKKKLKYSRKTCQDGATEGSEVMGIKEKSSIPRRGKAQNAISKAYPFEKGGEKRVGWWEGDSHIKTEKDRRESGD